MKHTSISHLALAVATVLALPVPAQSADVLPGQSVVLTSLDAVQDWFLHGDGSTLTMLPWAEASHVGIGGGVLNADGAKILAPTPGSGDMGWAVNVGSSGTANLKGSTVTSETTAITAAGRLIAHNSTISGRDAGVDISRRATATFANSSIVATGPGGHAIDMSAIVFGGSTATLSDRSSVYGELHAVRAVLGKADSGTTLVVDGSHLESGTGAVLSVVQFGAASGQAAAFVLRNGSTVAAGNGVLLEASGLSAGPGGIVADLQIDNSVVTGHVFSRDGALVDVTLRNSASLTGAMVDVRSLTLDSAIWNVTADSNLEQLSLGSGTVAFTSPGAGGGAHKILTLGDFNSNGGTLVFNTVMAGDASLSDKMVITGDAYGPASVKVNKIGGTGADTHKGIELITVGGVSNAVFTLAGRAIVGSYEYFLHKGGAGAGTEGNWYLRSKLPAADPLPGPDRPEPLPGPDPRPYPLPGPDPDPYPLPGPEPEPCELDPAGPWCDPDNPGPGPDPELPGDGDEDPYPMPEPKPDPENPGNPDPILRPEGGAYLANLHSAQQMFRMGYHDRQAGQNAGHAWAKVDGSRDGFDAVSRQLDVRGNGQALSVGANVWQHESGSAAGVMLSSGNATSTSTNELTGYYARGKVKGEALGLYGTWRGGNAADPYAGFYVDGSVQRAQFRNRVEGVGLETERYKSRAWQGAVEAGYAFRVGGASNGGIYLEPQLQVGYTRWDQGQHTEANGTVVQTEDANGLFGRAGVRLSGVTRAMNGGVEVQPYVAAHWLHTRAGSQIRMNDEIVDARIPQNRGEFSAGASLNFGNGFGAWGGLSLQKASGYHQTSAQVGLSYRW